MSFGTAPKAVQRRSIDLASTPLYSGLPSTRKAIVDAQPRAGGGAASANVQSLFGLHVPAAAPDSAGGLAAGDSFSFPSGLATSDPRGLAAGFFSPAGDLDIAGQILAALGPKIDELMEPNRSEVDAVRSELDATHRELAATKSTLSDFAESFHDRCSRVHLRSVVPKALRRVMSTPPEYDIYSIGEARRDGPPTLYHPSGMEHAVTFVASPTC